MVSSTKVDLGMVQNQSCFGVSRPFSMFSTLPPQGVWSRWGDCQNTWENVEDIQLWKLYQGKQNNVWARCHPVFVWIPYKCFFLNMVSVLPDFLQSLKNLSRVWSPYKSLLLTAAVRGPGTDKVYDATRSRQDLQSADWIPILIGAPSTVPLSIITLLFFGGKQNDKKHHVGRSVAMTVDFGAIPAYPCTRQLWSTFPFMYIGLVAWCIHQGKTVQVN